MTSRQGKEKDVNTTVSFRRAKVPAPCSPRFPLFFQCQDLRASITSGDINRKEMDWELLKDRTGVESSRKPSAGHPGAPDERLSVCRTGRNPDGDEYPGRAATVM